jgi:hypothetical protein
MRVFLKVLDLRNYGTIRFPQYWGLGGLGLARAKVHKSLREKRDTNHTPPKSRLSIRLVILQQEKLEYSF